jgi:solute carrier family 25 carnitine/acylcarnitine transporter 20/29
MTETQAKDKRGEDPFGIKKFLSGGVGGICVVLVGHPFDTTKVKLQTSNEYQSAMDCVKRTIAREGIKGLYRGMATPLVFVTPLFAVCFWGFDLGCKLIRGMGGMESNQKLSLTQNAVAGGFSAFPATVLMTPIERVKILLQTQRPDSSGHLKFRGPVDVIKNIMKEGGIRSLYRGTFATLLRDIPGNFAYFGTYETLKNKFINEKSGELNKGAILFCGGTAGVTNWLVAIPQDVLKSRLQAAPEGVYKGLGDVFSKLIRVEGISALFKGSVPIMVRAFPANAAAFLGAEWSFSILDSLF